MRADLDHFTKLTEALDPARFM
jgi:hypothetical protein